MVFTRFPILFTALMLAVVPLSAQSQPRAITEFGSNLPAMTIGANDLVAIATYNAPEFTRTVRVGADGAIRMPMLKAQIAASGKMPAELEAAVAEALKAEQLIVDPFVTVTVLEYNSRPISVAGEVRNPVTFQAIGTVTLLDALTKAGGLGANAGPEILVSRQGSGKDGAAPLVQRIPVRGLVNDADPALNIRLSGGEEIRVPEVGRMYVVGNVKKPGAFPVRDATETTVMKALALAEGLTPYANKEAYLYRQADGSGQKTEIPVPLNAILERKSPDMPIQANDILYVPDNKGRRRLMTTLERTLAFGTGTLSGILIWTAAR